MAAEIDIARDETLNQPLLTEIAVNERARAIMLGMMALRYGRSFRALGRIEIVGTNVAGDLAPADNSATLLAYGDLIARGKCDRQPSAAHLRCGVASKIRRAMIARRAAITIAMPRSPPAIPIGPADLRERRGRQARVLDAMLLSWPAPRSGGDAMRHPLIQADRWRQLARHHGLWRAETPVYTRRPK